MSQSNVALTIAGRRYTVACAPGEEAHIAALGESIDGKLAGMNMAGQSEPRTLLYAALLLADELHEARASTPATTIPMDDGTAEALENCAARLEALAAHLEEAPVSA